MDNRIVFLLAMAATCVLSIPSQPSCPCGRVYYPICASDWQTSNNMCEYECREEHLSRYGQQLSILKEGVTCEELKKKYKPYGSYAPYV